MKLRTLALLLGLCACDAKSGAEPAVPSRVVAVKADKKADVAELCDVMKPAAEAPSFALPELDGATTTVPTGRARWVNVWATWCPPCVEELPLIASFARDQSARGKPLDVTLVSVDATQDIVDKFASTHPEAKSSLRAKDPSAIEAWLPTVGLDAGATLPVHLFLDAQGKVRCARTGSVRDTDLPRIQKLLEGL